MKCSKCNGAFYAKGLCRKHYRATLKQKAYKKAYYQKNNGEMNGF